MPATLNESPLNDGVVGLDTAFKHIPALVAVCLTSNHKMGWEYLFKTTYFDKSIEVLAFFLLKY